jgi:hypothetical protein
MRRILVLSVLLLAVIAGPAFGQDQFDIGISATPLFAEEGETATDILDNLIPGFHVGYRFLYLLYASWDALVLPPRIVESMTTRFIQRPDGSTVVQEGYFRPGFLNLIDAGIQIVLGPFVVSAELGVNQVYIYKQDELDPRPDANFGANVLVGAGLKFGTWGITGRAFVVFPDIESAIFTLSSLASSDNEFAAAALDVVLDNLIPQIMVTLYLGGDEEEQG